jgi:hypothetical protein
MHRMILLTNIQTKRLGIPRLQQKRAESSSTAIAIELNFVKNKLFKIGTRRERERVKTT